MRSLATVVSVVSTAAPAATSFGQLVGSPEEEPVAHGRIDEAGVLGVVGDHEHVGPVPRFDGGPSRPPQVQRRLAEHRDHVARSRSKEPGPLVVVADGEGEGDVGVAEIHGAPEVVVVDVPGAVIVQGAESARGARRRAWRGGT